MESLPLVLSVFLMGLLPLSVVPTPSPSAVASLSVVAPAIIGTQEFPGQRLARSLSASGVVIVDLQSGQELFARYADTRRSVGSLTKLMTAVIIAESHEMDEVVTVPKGIEKTDGSTMRLPPGSHFTVGDLLSALLIPSANDAAETLARYHSGSREAFVKEMNERAAMLGLRNSSFANPSGLDDTVQWSTPRDIAWLASYALRNPELRSRMSTAHATIKSAEGDIFTLEHTHALLGKDSMVIAGKTGTTIAAKQCLFSLVTEHGREYVVVLLGSRERYADMRAVLRILVTLFA
ncbi:D-alanyl-D-alanine carboxypeptidase [Candidatus Peribacteria bacterium]|nr:D-alanyl-D-alanine carboxypeptidase [Candidatus Peribacteria bacterium]